MSLSSKGCRAQIENVLNVKPTAITAEITTKTCIIVNGQKRYQADFTGRVCLMNPRNEKLSKGDLIKIKSFYIKNRDGRVKHQFDTYVITEWEIERRNAFVRRYYKQKSADEFAETKRRQRQAIEEEIEAEEQDLDEYIENIDENNPF